MSNTPRWLIYRLADVVGVFLGSLILSTSFIGSSSIGETFSGDMEQLFLMFSGILFSWYILTGYIIVTSFKNIYVRSKSTLEFRLFFDIGIFVYHSFVAITVLSLLEKPIFTPEFFSAWSMVLLTNMICFILIELDHFKVIFTKKNVIKKWRLHRVVDILSAIICCVGFYFLVEMFGYDDDNYTMPIMFISAYCFMFYIPVITDNLIVFGRYELILRKKIREEFLSVILYFAVIILVLSLAQLINSIDPGKYFPAGPLIFLNWPFWVVIMFYFTAKVIAFCGTEDISIVEFFNAALKREKQSDEIT